LFPKPIPLLDEIKEADSTSRKFLLASVSRNQWHVGPRICRKMRFSSNLYEYLPCSFISLLLFWLSTKRVKLLHRLCVAASNSCCEVVKSQQQRAQLELFLRELCWIEEDGLEGYDKDILKVKWSKSALWKI